MASQAGLGYMHLDTLVEGIDMRDVAMAYLKVLRCNLPAQTTVARKLSG
jgi:hypothetical protein